jgi:hypothetical protein
MIPVRYTGNTTKPEWKVADPTKNSHPGSSADDDWFDYDNRQWANAVTITEAAAKSYAYKDANGNLITDQIVNESDVLGYWVYIPRYAYEVQRRDAIDAPIAAQTLFDIRFEKKTAGLKTPIATTSTTTTHNNYRTARSAYRTYPGHDTTALGTTTWSTHPAFWWDENSDGIRASDGSEELNGIWVGKFETTGSVAAPTIKPNLKSQISQVIGVQYDIAGSMGVTKPSGGNNTTVTQNNQRLSTFNTHQQKNSEWGAVTYLSNSIYGSNGAVVKINAAYKGTLQDGNTKTGYGITGCGPQTSSSESQYTITDDITGAVACTYDGASHSYHTATGILASTTQNPTGVYDMSGGAWEYVMGNRTSSTTGSTTNSYMSASPALKYLNLYGVGITLPNVFGTGNIANKFGGTKPGWSEGTSEQYYNFDICTFETCGGQANYETTMAQSVSSDDQSWGSDFSNFVYSSIPWFVRGGTSNNTSIAGLFASYRISGYDVNLFGFRVVAGSL